MAAAERFIQVDGLKIRYLEEGEGRAILLLHGASLGSSADVWEQNLKPLASHGFRVIAFDQPGFGLSDNPQDYSVSYRRRFILKFMDALGIDRACLIGHSQAGGMVVRLALEEPGRASQVIVVATGSLLPPLPESGAGRAREGEEGGDAPPTLEDTRRLLENNLFHKSLITPGVVKKRQRMSVGKNFAAFVARSKAREAEKEGTPLWQRLKEVSVPLLMLYGAQDRGSAAKRCALLKEKERGLKVEAIENAGHLLMWDAGKVFNQKVLELLST